MKKQILELKPGLRIGVGAGRLVLAFKEVKEDGLEVWAVNYHLTIDGPIRDAFYLSAQVIRYIAKVETLERDLKSSKEYSRRMKIRKEELETQLADSERKRDVANRTNKQRIDELENESISFLEKFVDYKKEINQTIESKDKQFGQLHSIIQSEQKQNKIAFKIIDKLKFWNMVLGLSGLMFLGLWLSALYF
jgi:hypothetical protein